MLASGDRVTSLVIIFLYGALMFAVNDLLAVLEFAELKAPGCCLLSCSVGKLILPVEAQRCMGLGFLLVVVKLQLR